MKKIHEYLAAGYVFVITRQSNDGEAVYRIEAKTEPLGKAIIVFGLTPEQAILKMERVLATGIQGTFAEDFLIYAQEMTLYSLMEGQGYAMVELGKDAHGIYCHLTGEANLARINGDSNWLEKATAKEPSDFQSLNCLMRLKNELGGPPYGTTAFRVSLEINPDRLPDRRVFSMPVAKFGTGASLADAINAAIAAKEQISEADLKKIPATVELSLSRRQ